MVRTVAQRLQALRFAQEIFLISGAYIAYEFVRSLAAGRTLDAIENTAVVVRVEQALGIFAELNFQVALVGFDALIQALSLWYFWGHFPLIIAVAVWAFYRRNGDYAWARNAIFVSGAIALLVYVIFPVAPPRLLPGAGFVDTLRGAFVLQYEDSSLVNQFAAVPSMHQGFSLIMGAVFYRMLRGRMGLFLLLALPTVMFISIVATGNHWFLDAMLGAVVALMGMTIATRIERRGLRWRMLLRGPRKVGHKLILSLPFRSRLH